jgi:2-oxoisovalerate dehydrogenase E1 component
MLRTLMAAARVDGRVCVFVEPIALYHTRDLTPGDGAWVFPFPAQDEAIAIGEVGVYEDGVQVEAWSGPTELALLTYGNGVPMCLRVAKTLSARGVRARVVDLRWIAPLPVEAVRRHAEAAEAVLVVDECRRSGSVSEAIAAALADVPSLRERRYARVTSADSFIPLAEAANLVLLQEDEILESALSLTAARRTPP